MGKLYSSKIITSIKGARLGLSFLSSGETGTSKKLEFLVGPDAYRAQHSTAETTSTNLAPTGISVLDNSSAGSSQVFTIDPPIPGCEKTIVFKTTANSIYLKGPGSETFQSSQGTSNTVLKSTNTVVGAIKLIPVSTAAWMVSAAGLSTASFALSTTT